MPIDEILVMWRRILLTTTVDDRMARLNNGDKRAAPGSEVSSALLYDDVYSDQLLNDVACGF